MNPIFVFDPEPRLNDYLYRMYYVPLVEYLNDNGFQASFADNLEVSNSIVIIHGDRLKPETILKIKNNGNKLIVFDINDSSYFSSAYNSSEETLLIDLVFKVSGIPKKNETVDLSIDRNFKIMASEVFYLPEENWTTFETIKNQGKIKPLPYVLWEPINNPQDRIIPHQERNGHVLLRGGNHFWRVILFYRLVQQGMNDNNSLFITADYFKQSMIQRFRYCDACIREKESTGVCSYDTNPDISQCKSPIMWGVPGEFYSGPLFGRNEFGHWNNKCPASFFWLAKEYERNRGPLNHDAIQKALNGSMEPIRKFVDDLSHASFYADFKWLNTIYVPPRFWESAALGTINFYPKRTEDQDYFPEIKEGVHYLSYPDDMSQFDIDIGKDRWTEISNNAKSVYEKWIRGYQYSISTNLLEHIKNCILEKV